MLPVSAEHRVAAGISAGAQVEVSLELDNEPREVELPSDVAAVVSADSAVLTAWEKLSPSSRKAHVIAIESAKTEESRQRRLAKVVEQLGG